jgi:hypothetical protein
VKISPMVVRPSAETSRRSPLPARASLLLLLGFGLGLGSA